MRMRLGGIGHALADRNFRIFSIGSVTSWFSFFVQVVAVSWTAWELTHSTTWLAIIALLDIAPNVLLVPLGSVLADRYDRFRIEIVAYFLALLQALDCELGQGYYFAKPMPASAAEAMLVAKPALARSA